MIDVAHEVNAVARRVGTRVLEAGEANSVTIVRDYDTGIADLWDACTKPERIARWFLPVSGALRVGGHYQLQGNASGTIERCEPPRNFTATWEYGGNVSWIELRLSARSEDRTRLELEHIAPGDAEHWTQFGPGAVGVGWDMALMGLGRHLRSGIALDPESAAAWSASQEGRTFVTTCSELWCEAAIAAGAQPDAARAAAQRTTAFYLGAAPT
jgi:uncharacterized protein YndB with AHSA1/START domain